MAKCKFCGADIIWIQTAAGKKMPCNAEEVVYWQKKGGKEKVVTPNGEVVSAELTGRQNDATGMGYIAHFATCKSAGVNR